MKTVLFVSWDGADSVYMESLFMPILARLQLPHRRIHVIQFTWASELHVRRVRATAIDFGLGFTGIRMRRKPTLPRIVAMIVRGARVILTHSRRTGEVVLMPRSLLPAAMVLLARRFGSKVQLFFDADGLMADERADFGGWRRSDTKYRILRWVERRSLELAAVIMTRTRHAKDILLARAPAIPATRIHVIPNGRDEAQFHPGSEESRAAVRAALNVPPTAPFVVYVGSIGPQYYPDEMCTFFGLVLRRRPDAVFLVLAGNASAIEEAVHRAGLPAQSVLIQRAEAAAVPQILSAGDVGLALRAPVFSQRAVSPVKVAEYLLCGLPVLATVGVGDLDEQITSEVGMMLTSVDAGALAAAADWLVTVILPHRDEHRAAARARGVELFGLAECVTRYSAAFASLDAGAHDPAR